MEIKKGDVFIAHLKETYSCIQKGLRPCIILSNSKSNYFSGIVNVIPVTSSRTKKPLPTHVKLENENLLEGSIALAEQLLTISQDCLTKYICSLDETTMSAINKAIDIQLQKTVIPNKDNEIEIYQKALRKAKAIEFLEEFIIKQGETTELMNSLYIQVVELQDYCKTNGIDLSKIYISKLDRGLNVKVG